MTHLLFLPGVGADPDFWRPAGDRLPESWTKTYLGWPGLGHQPHDPRVQSVEDMIAYAADRLGEGATDVVGQSMGGVIALQLALRYPDRVRRLVLAVTSGGVDMSGLGATDWRPDYAREFPKAVSWIRDWRPDYASDLSRVTHPTLLLWGDSDPISPLGVGKRLQNLLPNTEMRVIEGGAHDLAVTHAEEVAPLIRAHLEA
jgi:pimeloyl-ACP methyl ester carboxylesterase